MNEWRSKRRHTKTKCNECPLCCIDDIRHILKYEYIPENARENILKCGHKYKYIPGSFRKSILKCGNYQAQMNELYTHFPEKIDEAGIRAEILNWDSHTKRLTVVINEKLR